MYALILGACLFVGGNVIGILGHGAPWLENSDPTLARRTFAGAAVSVAGAVLILAGTITLL